VDAVINKFERQLEKWNGGVLRGAQAKLARLLQVSTATVALWTTGKRRPSKGYLARMAQIFGLDAYDVMRLFPSATTYPDLQKRPETAALRDAPDPVNLYSTDIFSGSNPGRNSVSLPLLTPLPPQFPHFEESDVAEWWTLPRRAAQGAKWLAEDTRPNPAGNKDLYFIRPSDTPEYGSIMLLRAEGRTQLWRVRAENGQTALYFTDGKFYKTLSTQDVTFLGVAVRKITDA